MRERVALSDGICADYLDHEYAELCLLLLARLSRKRPSPLNRTDGGEFDAQVMRNVVWALADAPDGGLR